MQIQYFIKRLGFKDIVLYLWHPSVSDMVGQFNENLICYHITDEYSSYTRSQIKKNTIGQMEHILLSKADIVLVASKILLEKKKQFKEHTYFVPNGVNYQLYSQAFYRQTEEPDDLKDIPHPRIGYVGNVSDKVDFRLLKEIAIERPSWSIILIGPISIYHSDFQENMQELKERKNVFFLGHKDSSKLPAYIMGIDVGLMCYRLNEWSSSLYPVKMHEYLACGKPVVSVDIPAVREFNDVIKIAHLPSQWIDSIEEGFKEKDSSYIDKRIAVAKENTWEKRAKEVMQLINQRLESKIMKKKNISRENKF